MGDSYRRYRTYRANRQQYKMDQVAAPIAMMLIIGFLTKYGWVILGCIIAGIVIRLCKRNSVTNNSLNTVDEIVKTKEIAEDTKTMKTTEKGYLNKNEQRNNGRTNKPGTDFGQWFYEMECMKCGHKYHANGTDIWQRKCPKCQGGRP